MKNIIFVVIGCISVLSAGCSSTKVFVKDSPSFANKRVAVFNFEYEPKSDTTEMLYGATWTNKAGQIVADQISTYLLEFANIKSASLSDDVLSLMEKSEYKKIGEKVGADYLIFGIVNEHCAIGITGIVRGFAAFSVKCIDAETSEVVWSTSVSSSSLYSSPTAVSEKLSERVVKKLIKELQKTQRT